MYSSSSYKIYTRILNAPDNVIDISNMKYNDGLICIGLATTQTPT